MRSPELEQEIERLRAHEEHTREQRDAAEEAYRQSIAEIERLRAFCRTIMTGWPNSCVDGFDMQVAAAASGLLIESTVTEPCCEDCSCREYYAPEEFAEGIKCYKLADWLTEGGA